MSENVKIVDKRGEALAYLQKHKLLQLFEIIGAKIACEKPSDPNAFMLAELSKAQVMASRGQPVALFQEKVRASCVPCVSCVCPVCVLCVACVWPVCYACELHVVSYSFLLYRALLCPLPHV